MTRLVVSRNGDRVVLVIDDGEAACDGSRERIRDGSMVLAMFDALRERIAAANQVLSEAGCDCDCDHPRCECDEECESNRCLGCRVEKALGGAQ